MRLRRAAPRTCTPVWGLGLRVDGCGVWFLGLRFGVGVGDLGVVVWFLVRGSGFGVCATNLRVRFTYPVWGWR